jgi:uncharacterized membrane-anchored protein YhcB (DUF1043 family)
MQSKRWRYFWLGIAVGVIAGFLIAYFMFYR